MSFSAQVKDELCQQPFPLDCCARSELYGALLHTSLFSHREIRVSTSSPRIANRLQRLFQQVAGFSPTPLYTDRKTQFLLTNPEELKCVFELFGYTYQSHVTYHLNRNIIENDCCIPAFLRGMFLLTGTVAGPDKKNHLEMKSAHPNLCGEVISLLLDLHFCPKVVQRQGISLLYFKDSTSVQRFLSLIGAPEAAHALQQARKEKHLRNHINRQVNCDTANLVKATDASVRQVAAIQRVLQESGEKAFPENLHETIRLRLKYPMDSLSELAARFNPPISKPGLSHRLNRITALAQQTKKED